VKECGNKEKSGGIKEYRGVKGSGGISEDSDDRKR
jgi:hypothetical protein